MKDIKKLFVLLSLLSILLLTNICLNLISNEKYSEFETKPNFYYKYNNFREYDLYNKLINYKKFFDSINERSTGYIKTDLHNKIDYTEIKTGTGNKSIDKAIKGFQERQDKLQDYHTRIKEGQNLY